MNVTVVHVGGCSENCLVTTQQTTDQTRTYARHCRHGILMAGRWWKDAAGRRPKTFSVHKMCRNPYRSYLSCYRYIYLFTGKYIYPRTCKTNLSLDAICLGIGCGIADTPRVFHRAETLCKGPSGHQFILGEHSVNLRVMREGGTMSSISER